MCFFMFDSHEILRPSFDCQSDQLVQKYSNMYTFFIVLKVLSIYSNTKLTLFLKNPSLVINKINLYM